MYRPQSVQTLGPGQNSFKKVLVDSVNSLNSTNPKHISSPDTPRSRPADQHGLGPSFQVAEKESFRFEYDPNHPDADENVMVRYPDIDLVREMTQMISANRLYEANLTSIEAEKQIIKRSLEI